MHVIGSGFLTSSLAWRSLSSSSFWISASDSVFWLWFIVLTDCWPHFEEDGSCTRHDVVSVVRFWCHLFELRTFPSCYLHLCELLLLLLESPEGLLLLLPLPLQLLLPLCLLLPPLLFLLLLLSQSCRSSSRSSGRSRLFFCPLLLLTPPERLQFLLLSALFFLLMWNAVCVWIKGCIFKKKRFRMGILLDQPVCEGIPLVFFSLPLPSASPPTSAELPLVLVSPLPPFFCAVPLRALCAALRLPPDISQQSQSHSQIHRKKNECWCNSVQIWQKENCAEVLRENDLGMYVKMCSFVFNQQVKRICVMIFHLFLSCQFLFF